METPVLPSTVLAVTRIQEGSYKELRLTIPKRVKKRMDLKQNDYIIWLKSEDDIIIRKSPEPDFK